MLEAFQKFDEAVFHFINQSLANPLGDWLLPIFNYGAPFVPLMILGLAWCAYRNSKPAWILAAILIVATILSDGLVFNTLKKAVARPRPAKSLQVRQLAEGATGGHSFPSSHTANAFLVATILTAAFPRKWWLFLGIASLLGFARVYVGVHYPSDILGSAILGSLMGLAFFAAARRFSIIPATAERSLAEARDDKKKESKETERFLVSNGLATRNDMLFWCILVAIQVARLIWAAMTDLDVPPDAARLWFLGTHPLQNGVSFERIWFDVFGGRPLALWAIPWFFQTIWIFTMAWLIRKSAGNWALRAFVGLIVFLPIISQLSFLGSPWEVLQDSNWNTSIVVQSAIFYLILGLPLWLSAIYHFREFPIASLFTLAGWILGSSFPHLSWWIPLLMSSGTIFRMAQTIGNQIPSWSHPHSKWFRFWLCLGAAWGILVGFSVYNPRFLRKLDLSLLPRNSPHYIQTGWKEWADRIRPHMTSIQEVWTDSFVARDQLQYYLGHNFHVVTLEQHQRLPPPPPSGAFYIREVYIDFHQKIPTLIFFGRRDAWIADADRARMKLLYSTEIFRKADPVRQLQLYFIPGADDVRQN
jgi:undecaprenyl-diphosphatase